MSRVRASAAAACAFYVLFTFLLVVRSPVSTEIFCGPTFEKNTDRWPVFLACLGDGGHGNWTKLRRNGTHRLLANFNETNEQVFDPTFAVTLIKDARNHTGATLQIPAKWGNRPFNLPGAYFCSMGNETCQINVLTALDTSGYSTQYNLELTCRPSPLAGQRFPIDPRLKANWRPKYPSYNITWYINGTVVGWSFCNGTFCTVTYNQSSPYVQHHNVSIYGDKANVSNHDPLCLSCSLVSGEEQGITSICTLGTDDPRLWGIAGVGKFGRTLPVVGEDPDGESPTAGDPVAGSGPLIGGVLFVCVVAGLLWLVRLRRKRRSGGGHARTKYRPSVGTTERNAS